MKDVVGLVEGLVGGDREAAASVLEGDRLSTLGLPPPPAGASADDPAVGLGFLLRMAARTVASRHPAPDPARVERLRVALTDRPGRDDEHGQLAIDLPSTLRRADVLRELAAGGPVLAVGDDDAVTVALALDGTPALSAVDIDPRLIRFLREHGVEASQVDVFHQAVPEPLRGRFAAVVTDPFRDLDGGVGFLSFAAACVRRQPHGQLLWVDHPDWNFEHHEVRATLVALGFQVTHVHEDLHAYPLPLEISEPKRLAEAMGLPHAPLRTLAEQTHAWSHLLVLERA